ncbi:MAG: hypothetical protein JWM40_937, partial [Frankiales bacterium]|nr:hypothetical protein [Frankiales bacterium]
AAAVAAAADRDAAAQERHLARMERALGAANAIQPTPTAALLHDVPRDADDATLAARVERLRTEMPGLFTVAGAPPATPGAPGTPPPAPGSDPGTPPPPPAGGRTPDGAFGVKGREEAARRFTTKTA